LIPELRKRFNSSFRQSAYESLLRDLNSAQRWPADFRVAETPVFLSQELTDDLLRASNEILATLQAPGYAAKFANAVPPELAVPGETPHPVFLQLDFAICKDADGAFTPRLIELQGFPSLYCYQILLDDTWRKHFSIPKDFSSYFNGLDRDKYIALLKKIIVADADPENVILLELEPEKQKTRIDFACTESYLGFPTVDLKDLIERKKKLFYKKDGNEIPVERIYNRVIFDDLARRERYANFHFGNEHNVTWVGHPNWFFKISKYTLPLLSSSYCPSCFFLSSLDSYPPDLEHYVLKPLFSFAGAGVEMDVNRQMLDAIRNRDHYILQRKVDYAPLVETPDGFSKVEIRMMFVWTSKPMLVNNLVRMSKGKMMGVDFNKDKTWIGSSLAYHPEIQ